MIYLTGDTHGDPVRFIENNIGDENWTDADRKELHESVISRASPQQDA